MADETLMVMLEAIVENPGAFGPYAAAGIAQRAVAEITRLRASLAPPEALPEDVRALIQEARATYAAVALYPEREPDGLNKLLALRNMIPRLVAALADRQRAVEAAVAEEREACAAMFDAMFHGMMTSGTRQLLIEAAGRIRARSAAQEG